KDAHKYRLFRYLRDGATQNGTKWDTVAWLQPSSPVCAGGVRGVGGLGGCRGAGFAQQVQGDAAAQAAAGADAVDALLHLAVAAVAAFHGVGGGGQELVVQEGEGFFQVGAEQPLEGFADL